MSARALLPTESGLGECARMPSAPACDGLDSGLTLLVIGVPGLLVYLLLAGCATLVVSRTSPPRKPLWLIIVWCLPVAGALGWFVYHLTTRWAHHRADHRLADDRST